MKFLQTLLIVAFTLCLSSVLSLEESFCAGTGFYNLNRKGQRGYRTIGWDRLLAVNADWASFFWSVQAVRYDPQQAQTPVLRLSFVKDSNGNVLNGWIHVSVERPGGVPFHYAAIWVVTERNEAYGSFIFDNQRNLRSCSGAAQLYSPTYAYIPCSAGPVNVESVPSMFIYANLEMKLKDSKIEATVSNSKRGVDSLSILWRSPPQSYCNRPKKFRFVYAANSIEDWRTYGSNWNGASRPSSMWFAGYNGPIVQVSDWIFPNFYGHPSNIDPLATIECGSRVSKSNWVSNLQGEQQPDYWYLNVIWRTFGSSDGEFGGNDVKKRSTCKGFEPTHNEILGYKGRCTDSTGSAGIKYYTATENQGIKCADQNEPLGKGNFKGGYSNYLGKLEKFLNLNCQCRIKTKQTVTTRSLKILMTPPPLPCHTEVSQVVKFGISSRDEATEYKKEYDVCELENVNLPLQEIVDKGGICVQNPVGKLVYGVRQWHGVTSLCVAVVLTPLSIFVARYTKGDMEIVEGRVPMKAWYLTHVTLVFPTIWMHASGMATIGRQTDVIGHSLTTAARWHRILGVVTFVLIPFHMVTGYFRPVNLKCRKVIIFIHWFGGYAHHILELFNCWITFMIPLSPTTGSGIFSPHFGKIQSTKTGLLLISWLVFSILFNVFLTIRKIRHDWRMGTRGRSVFPIIIPVFTAESSQDLVDAEHTEEMCLERGALLIYLLVSCIVFVITIVALYQAFHEHLYYGFGPMSCTHDSNGKFISSNNSNVETECVK